jgi:hypothetical protein
MALPAAYFSVIVQEKGMPHLTNNDRNVESDEKLGEMLLILRGADRSLG